MQLKKTLTTIISLLLLPLISAYPGGWGGYYGSPLDYLENEWVMFAIIFIIAFATIYFAIYKTFKENRAIAGIISLGISLLISMAVAQRGWLYSYAGDGIGNTALLLGFLIIVVAMFKIMLENFGPPGAFVGLILSLLLFKWGNSANIFPETLNYGPMSNFIEILQGPILGILIFFAIVVVVVKLFGRKQQSALDVLKDIGKK